MIKHESTTMYKSNTGAVDKPASALLVITAKTFVLTESNIFVKFGIKTNAWLMSKPTRYSNQFRTTSVPTLWASLKDIAVKSRLTCKKLKVETSKPL